MKQTQNNNGENVVTSFCIVIPFQLVKDLYIISRKAHDYTVD